MKSMNKERGFLLIYVVLALALIAAISLALSYQTVADSNTTTGERQRDQLRYVAEAGMAHAKVRLAENTTCTAYNNLATTSFGNDSYSATISPSDGSPVALSATSVMQNGAELTVFNPAVPVYQAANNIVLQPGSEGQDAEIWDQQPNNNYGSATTTWVSSASNDTTRTLLRFDTAAIPAGVKVLQANLSLRRDSGSGANQPVSAHRILNSWSEDSVTWNERESGTNWDSAGIDFDSTAVTTTLVGPANNRYEWDVTPLVRGWLDGSYPNDGVALVAAIAGMPGEQFDTSDATNSSLWPSLSITYACECGTVCTDTASSPEPIAHWKFDEVSGTNAVDSVSGHDGSLVNGPTWTSGEKDGAIRLDGTNDYVSVPDSDALELTSTFTAATWVRADTANFLDSHRILSNEASGTNANFWVSMQSGQFWVGVGGQFYSAPNALVPDTWYHIAVSFDDAANSLRIYVDGDLVLDQSTTATIAPSGTPLYIGTNWEGSKFWDGLIDDVRIYDQVLAPADIATLAYRPPAGDRLLFVVANDANLSNAEKAYQTQFESWGYSVQIVDDGESQSYFDKSVSDNDVAFVSAKVSDKRLDTKLTNTTIGVVYAAAHMSELLDVAEKYGYDSGTSISITNEHYITSPFPVEMLATSTNSESLAYLGGNVATGLSHLANSASGSALVALETGATTLADDPAVGRRVLFPWASSDFEPGALTADGLTILQRSLEWGAGAGTGTSGLLAHWKFDEGSGSLAADSAGGHDGTLEEESSWTTGQLDDALMLDGNDDYVDVPFAAELALTDEMTFTAWIKASNYGSSYQTILSRDAGDSGSNYWFGTWQNELVFGLWSGSVFREVFTSGLSLQSGTWYHIAASFDTASDQVDLYVDGASVHQGNLPFDPETPLAPVWIGRSIDGEYWDGALDDVRIYDQVLDAAAIAALGTKDSGGGSDTACNGTFSDEFNDQSYSGNDGNLAFSGGWVEVGESDGPQSGDEQVVRDLSEYQLRIRDNNNGGEGVEREANLSGASEAEIRYEYRRNGLDRASDYVAIEVSRGGVGDVWTEISRIEGPGSDSEYEDNDHDISDFISATTKIRLITSSSMGNTDTVFFDNIEISCKP